VELKPLSGLGDIIVKPILQIPARFGCRYTAAPQSIGFRDGLLRA
jgi:hypothetical protein